MNKKLFDGEMNYSCIWDKALSPQDIIDLLEIPKDEEKDFTIVTLWIISVIEFLVMLFLSYRVIELSKIINGQ